MQSDFLLLKNRSFTKTTLAILHVDPKNHFLLFEHKEAEMASGN